jgi:hypothetical protein
MKKFQLNRIVQCAKCPWKVSTNPHTIPDGYSVERHRALECTIAKDLNITIGNAMACHHSNGNDEMYCIGWLNNQLGPGNNIGLRIKFMSCENGRDIKVKGKQHLHFEDTLPL